MKTNLYCLNTGITIGLYTDVIDLSTLGRLHVERASTIEFDNAAQFWRVYDLDRHCIYSSSSREDCLNWERGHFGEIQ